MAIEHVSLLHLKDKKILLVLGNGKDIWQAPGGKSEKGETDEETLIRECNEELSVHIKPETIKHYKTISGKAHSKTEDIGIEIRIYSADFEGDIKPQAEIERAEYFSHANLPKLPDIGVQFVNELKQEGLLD